MKSLTNLSTLQTNVVYESRELMSPEGPAILDFKSGGSVVEIGRKPKKLKGLVFFKDL